MARKVRLTALQRDVLWLLEEAGEETLATILVTLKLPTPETLSRTLETLVRLGYVSQTERGGTASVVLTTTGRQALTI